MCLIIDARVFIHRFNPSGKEKTPLSLLFFHFSKKSKNKIIK